MHNRFRLMRRDTQLPTPPLPPMEIKKLQRRGLKYGEKPGTIEYATLNAVRQGMPWRTMWRVRKWLLDPNECHDRGEPAGEWGELVVKILDAIRNKTDYLQYREKLLDYTDKKPLRRKRDAPPLRLASDDRPCLNQLM